METMPVVVVSGGESKVRCCEEQYCVGTWDAHESGKLDMYCQSCGFPGSPALAGQFFTTEPPGELLVPYYLWFFFLFFFKSLLLRRPAGKIRFFQL